MHLAHYLRLLQVAEANLDSAYLRVAEDHGEEPDVSHLCRRLATQSADHAQIVQPFAERYAGKAPEEPDRLHTDLFSGTRTGGLGLLRDLHDLYLMACECDLAWTVIEQAAYGARDEDLLAVVHRCHGETQAQLRWLRTRIRQTAPQALVVAE